MNGILKRFLLIMLLVLPATIMLSGNGGSLVVRAQDEDILEGEEDDIDATIETDDGDTTTEEEGALEEKEEEEEDDRPLKASPDCESNILFTAPTSTDFPAGEIVRFLVGFVNKGKKEFYVENMEASFRYPQDYSYHIQNFSMVDYDRTVEPGREATFSYAFTPSETFSARPFGLTVNLNYRDTDGNSFQDAVYNDTVNIVEKDEGFDGETFFLYVFLAAAAVLLLVLAHQFLGSFGKKRLSKPKPVIETGTQNKGDVDYDWLPEGTIGSGSSPRRSPKTSPRQRRSKRGAGSDKE